MSTLLNNTLYEVTPDKLIIDSKQPLDVKIISIKANQGKLKRGTVISLTNTEEYVVFGSLVAAQTTAKANCIIADEVDTTSTTATANAVVYISGNFNKNALIVTEGSSLDAGDIEDLRAVGIFVMSAIS